MSIRRFFESGKRFELTRGCREAWGGEDFSDLLGGKEDCDIPDDHDLPFVEIVVIDETLWKRDELLGVNSVRNIRCVSVTCGEPLDGVLCELEELTTKDQSRI